MTVELYLGDCLEVMKSIPDKSIDAIITDLPYGTTACSWDTVIPFEPMWVQVKRICKGVFVTTASQPFTSRLINSNFEMFKYCLVWNKKFGIPAHAKIRPMKIHEDIVFFGSGTIPYYPQMVQREKPIKSGGNKCASITSPLTRVEGWKKTYDKKFPVSILNFPRDIGRTVHPTQKPVELLEYLIKTYTNEGDTVLDICAGSGTTGVACVNTNRNFIGIELREDYYKIMEKRIAEARQQMRLEICDAQ